MDNNLIKELSLHDNEKNALADLKNRIKSSFPDCEIILFGSMARGGADNQSDIDILILVNEPPDRKIRNLINDISYDIELRYDVVFGKIIMNRNEWDTPLSRAMPLHISIEREGIVL